MLRFTSIALTLFLLFILSTVATADATGSCTFSGSVQLDDADVAEGTLITAIIAGDAFFTHTAIGYGYATYSLTISPPQGKNYPDGSKVTFKVKGHTAGQTATFKAGENVRLNLTASTTTGLSSSTINLVLISLAALLALCFVALYLLSRRRGVTIAESLKRTIRPSQKVQPATVGNNEQTVNRYIWDSSGMLWVENIKPAKGGTARPEPATSPPVSKVAVTGRPARTITQTLKKPDTGKGYYTDDSPVELIIVAPTMAFGPMHKFTRSLKRLKDSHQFKVSEVQIVGNHTFNMRVFQRRPIPLKEMLESLPEVTSVTDEPQEVRGIYRHINRSNTPNARTIVVKLKD